MEVYLCYWCAVFIYLPLITALSQGIFRRKQRPPIDGSWSSWQSWSVCYKNVKNNTRTNAHFFLPWENFDIQSRNRTCTSPKPLFGGKLCELPSHRFRQCSCMNPLLGTNRIDDGLLSASSSLHEYPAREARFDNTSAGWCAKTKGSFFTETYIQIHFENFTNVGAISTIANAKGSVTRYKLKYSLNGRTWRHVHKDETNLVFTGNYLRGKQKMNAFGTHLVMKYLRVIPVQSFGLPCLKMEVYGCVFTCGSKLTTPYGELVAQSSENYDQNCLWRVEIRNTTSLTFVFSIFYVHCEAGYLDFLSGEFPYANAPLLKRICLREGDIDIPNLTLNRNSLWVKFVSNSSSNEVSFNIKYFAKCSQTIDLRKGEPVHIKSPNYPKNYFDNMNCTWTLTPPSPLKKIEITANEFNVESSESADECSHDYVLVDTQQYGGIRRKFASYCNNKPPPKNIVIAADKVVIVFKSDAYGNNKGFSFSIISGRKDILHTASTDKKETHPSQTDRPVGRNENRTAGAKRRPNGTYTRKVKPEKDDTWTVIIICTFSSLVVVLIATVVYLNCRRFFNSRNELSAQCAKAAAEEDRQKKHKNKTSGSARERNVLITTPSTPLRSVANEPSENYALLTPNVGDRGADSSQVETNGHARHVHDKLDVHIETIESPEEVDEGIESTSSSSSSPAKRLVISCAPLSNEDKESVI